jgi:hypothetical protein
MRNAFAALSVLLLALGLGACDPRLEPPPRHPDGEFDAPPAQPQEPALGGRFAQPPPGVDEVRSYPAPEPSRPAAPPPAAEGSASKRRSAADDRSAPESAEPSAAARGSGAPLAPPPRRERPGLATHWGETRYSPAHEVSFERDDPSYPSATAQLYYNNRSGARRLSPGGRWCQAEASLLGGTLRVRMLDSNGRPFSALCESGRVVSMGSPGERYTLTVENRSGQRYEVVASVDGLDVLDGEDASPDKRGYLVSAYSSVQIDGFRRSESEVAAFRLGDVAHSYAAGKGKAHNVGVIGLAVFGERPAPVVYYPRPPMRPWEDDTSLRDSADPFPGRYARPPAW